MRWKVLRREGKTEENSQCLSVLIISSSRVMNKSSLQVQTEESQSLHLLDGLERSDHTEDTEGTQQLREQVLPC